MLQQNFASSTLLIGPRSGENFHNHAIPNMWTLSSPELHTIKLLQLRNHEGGDQPAAPQYQRLIENCYYGCNGQHKQDPFDLSMQSCPRQH